MSELPDTASITSLIASSNFHTTCSQFFHTSSYLPHWLESTASLLLLLLEFRDLVIIIKGWKEAEVMQILDETVELPP